MDGACGGLVLCAQSTKALPETKGIPLSISAPGTCRMWIRYHKSRAGYSDFLVVVRDELTEVLGLAQFDLVPAVASKKPYEKKDSATGSEPGWRWEHVDLTFERPVEATLAFGTDVYHGGSPKIGREIDCVILSRDLSFDPRGLTAEELTEQTVLPQSGVVATVAPKGFSFSAPVKMNSLFFSGVDRLKNEFYFGAHGSRTKAYDYARLVQCGFNRDTLAYHGDINYGVLTDHRLYHWATPKKYRSFFSTVDTNDFFTSGGGAVSRSIVSLSYPPLTQWMVEQTEREIRKYKDDPVIDKWLVAGEHKGYLDYSLPSQIAFRRWLKDKYTTVDRLNNVWQTSWKTFEKIQPPKNVDETFGGYFDFVEFCGSEFINLLRANIQTVKQNDSTGRPILTKSSALMMFSPFFLKNAPFDFEQLADMLRQENLEWIGYDGYAADDGNAMRFELLRNLAPTKKIVHMEWNSHANDDRIQARTAWAELGKGGKGIGFFCAQASAQKQDPFKFAYQNLDTSARPKLAAAADLMHEVHRLEPMLNSARPVYPGQAPVAMLYSRQNLMLAPVGGSVWGGAQNSTYHVYRSLRSAGYEVRFVTPHQIEAGALKDIGALVLQDVQVLPKQICETIDAWIQNGGAAIADGFPGMFDETGKVQSGLASVFGVNSVRTEKTGSAGDIKNAGLAMQESDQGYGAVTERALRPEHIEETIGEIYPQPDSSHPVLRNLRNFNLSCFGLHNVEVMAGEVIGMGRGSIPAMILNEYGKGKTLYFSCQLGSVYEGAATRDEWDTTGSGLGFIRVLKAYLSYAGLDPHYQTDILYPRVAAKLRVETPLQTADGNLMVFLTSLNDCPLDPFELTMLLPELKDSQAFFVRDGTRDLQPIAVSQAGSGQTRLKIPSFDTRGAVLLIKKSDPLLALHLEGDRSAPGGLVDVFPSVPVEGTVTVWNTTGKDLKPGEIKLYGPLGWYFDHVQVDVPFLKPRESFTGKFNVMPPVVNSMPLVRPITGKYSAGDVRSTPATEVVWWCDAKKNDRLAY